MAGRAGGRVGGRGLGCLGGPGSFLVLDSFLGDLSTDSKMSVHEPASSSRTPQIPRAKQKRKNASTDLKAVEKKKKEGNKKGKKDRRRVRRRKRLTSAPHTKHKQVKSAACWSDTFLQHSCQSPLKSTTLGSRTPEIMLSCHSRGPITRVHSKHL